MRRVPLIATLWLLAATSAASAGNSTSLFSPGGNDFTLGNTYQQVFDSNRSKIALMNLGFDHFVLKNFSLGLEVATTWDLPAEVIGSVISHLADESDNTNSSAKTNDDDFNQVHAEIAGANVRARYRFLAWEVCSLFAEGSVGMLDSDEPILAGSKSTNTFTSQLGVFATMPISTGTWADVGVRWLWLADKSVFGNSDTRANGVLFYFGLTFRF